MMFLQKGKRLYTITFGRAVHAEEKKKKVRVSMQRSVAKDISTEHSAGDCLMAHAISSS